MAQIFHLGFYTIFCLGPRPAKPHVVQATVSAAAPVQSPRQPRMSVKNPLYIIIRLSSQRHVFFWRGKDRTRSFPTKHEYETLPKHHLLLLMEETLHQWIGSLSHYLQGFINPRWCRISSTNSITKAQPGKVGL